MSSAADHRPPLEAHRVSTDPRWRLEVVPSAASTNAEVAQRFRDGARDGLVFVADHQTAGRGRLAREWVTPDRAALTASFLLTPTVPSARWGWLPLLTGVAAARAVALTTGVAVELKWPNDLLADSGRKLGGILLERLDRADGTVGAVLGIGLNVSQTRAELPIEEATSLALAGAEVWDRDRLLGALGAELAALLTRWEAGEDLRADYLALCATPGSQVRVALAGTELEGLATGVDDQGRLLVRVDGEEQAVAAGDVVHVRPE